MWGDYVLRGYCPRGLCPEGIMSEGIMSWIRTINVTQFIITLLKPVSPKTYQSH